MDRAFSINHFAFIGGKTDEKLDFEETKRLNYKDDRNFDDIITTRKQVGKYSGFDNDTSALSIRRRDEDESRDRFAYTSGDI